MKGQRKNGEQQQRMITALCLVHSDNLSYIANTEAEGLIARAKQSHGTSINKTIGTWMFIILYFIYKLRIYTLLIKKKYKTFFDLA